MCLLPHFSYNNKNKFRSRYLRNTQTDAEKLLWSKLRSRQLLGYKFRRQHPIDSFIVDFYCLEKSLAIELDGSHHTKPDRIIYDKRRTERLNLIGIRVLRIWDSDVLKNTDDVLEVILRNLEL